jgi:hypothetical protein
VTPAEELKLTSDRMKEKLVAALPKPGETGPDAYTSRVYVVLLPDGRTFPTNVRACLKVAKVLGLQSRLA